MPQTSESSESSSDAKRPGTIQSVSIAARFLRALANAEEPLALAELARRTDAGRSTAHRYMQSLVKEGLATQDPASGFYDLGPTALSVGIAALKRTDAVEIAAQHMKKLASQVAASAGVAIWTERGPTLVRWYRSAYFSISSVGLGDILPVDNSACGHVFQAFLPANQIEAARRLQPRAFRGKPPSEETLDKIRSTFRSEFTSHLLPEITGQAVPVFDAQQEIACAMTTVTNLGQIRNPKDAEALFETAKEVAFETGGLALRD